MRTVLERNEMTLIKEHSSFIAIVSHITSKDSAALFLQEVKKEYPKAKHYCYAYRIDQFEKSSDDGEPAGTAGRPLLELLKKQDFNEVILVVVRYFGGVKLGASRLLSTYIEAGVATLSSCDRLLIKTRYVYHLQIPYKDLNRLKRLAQSLSFSLENIAYEATINVDVLADENSGTLLAEHFPNCPLDVMGTKKAYIKEY